jgi:hypothetical protein
MFEQFSSLTVKVAFQMKHDKGIKIMRAKLARLNEGYLLSVEQINQLFTLGQ